MKKQLHYLLGMSLLSSTAFSLQAQKEVRVATIDDLKAGTTVIFKQDVSGYVIGSADIKTNHSSAVLSEYTEELEDVQFLIEGSSDSGFNFLVKSTSDGESTKSDDEYYLHSTTNNTWTTQIGTYTTGGLSTWYITENSSKEGTFQIRNSNTSGKYLGTNATETALNTSLYRDKTGENTLWNIIAIYDLTELSENLNSLLLQAKDVLGTSPESTGAASLNQSILSIESSIDSYATIDAYQSAIDELKNSIKQFEFYTIGVVTHVINNPSFENDLSGWTYDGGFKTHTNDGIAPFKEGTVYAETWVASGNNLADSEISQTITDLPNGFYVLTAAAQGINQKESVEVDGVYLFANNSKTSISSLNTYSVNALVEDGTLKIGLRIESTNVNWVATDNYILNYYESEEAMYKGMYNDAYTYAEEVLNSASYVAVTGLERSELESAVKKDEPTTTEDYKIVIPELELLAKKFVEASDDYIALLTNIEYANNAKSIYLYASEDKTSSLFSLLEDTKVESREEAASKANTIIQAARLFAESSALAEGVEGAIVMNDAIINNDALGDLSLWTQTNSQGASIKVLSSEPFTDGAGISTYSYFDGGNWGQTAWTVDFSQNITIPAGRYLLTVTARSSEDMKSYQINANGITTDIPCKSSVGQLFNRGWNDACVEFIQLEDGDANIKVTAEADMIHQWISFSRFRLVKLAELNTESVDVTDKIINPSFESILEGWVNDGMKTANSNAIDPYKAGSVFAEQWCNSAGSLANISLSQTITGLDKGYYLVNAAAQAVRQSQSDLEILGASIFANENQSFVTFLDYYSVGTSVIDGTLDLGFKMEGTNANWVAIDNITMKRYNSIYEMALGEYPELKASALSLLENEDYANIIGVERSDLEMLTQLTLSTGKEYLDAYTQLIVKRRMFISSLNNYNSLQNAKALAADIEATKDKYTYASSELYDKIGESLNGVLNTGSDAKIISNNVLTYIRKYVESHALAANIEDAVNLTDLIVNPNAENVIDGTWNVTTTINLGILSNEPLTDGDENSFYKYFDGWGEESWSLDFSQEVELEPGKYLLSVTSRAKDTGVKVYQLYAGDVNADMPNIGSAIQTGIFARGFNDTSVEFKVEEEKSKVKLGVRGDFEGNTWMSFTRFRLVKIGENDEIVDPTDPSEPTGINDVTTEIFNTPADVYTIDGVLVRKSTESLDGLSKGIYIKGNKKIIIK